MLVALIAFAGAAAVREELVEVVVLRVPRCIALLEGIAVVVVLGFVVELDVVAVFCCTDDEDDADLFDG